MSTVLYEQVHPHVGRITLHRPDRLNALTYEMVEELFAVFDQVEADHDVRVVILTGAGRGFCSGFDIKEYERAPGTEELGEAQSGMRGQHRYWTQLIPRMRRLPQPIIAAVNGVAVGGGMSLVLGSDIRLAAPSARFLNGFIRIGLSGGETGLSFLLPRIIGASRAAEFMLTGQPISADEAARIGLISRVVDDGEVVDAALELAIQLLGNSPFGLWMTKELIWTNLEASSLQAAIDLEARTQILGELTADKLEALDALRTRREPTFHDR